MVRITSYNVCYTKLLRILEKYNNFKDTYKYAYIGLPKGFNGLSKPYFGTLNSFLKQHPNFKTKEKLPTLFYMHGVITSYSIHYTKLYE